jgi:hypothetical protein
MDRPTKLKLAVGAGAIAVVAIAAALGAVGALAVSGALSSGDERLVVDDGAVFGPLTPYEVVVPERDRRSVFGFPGRGVDLDEAASYLDVSERELRDRLDGGETLADIARDEDKSVTGLVDALADAAAERIDDAVEDGRLPPERAERLQDGLEDRIRELVNGEFPPRIFSLDCD